jgi:hypothetical protein
MLHELVFFLPLIVFFGAPTIYNMHNCQYLKWIWIFDTFDGPWPSYQYIILRIMYLPINIYNPILKRLVAKLNIV